MAKKTIKVGSTVYFAVYGSFEHLKGYLKGTVLAIGVTDTGFSTKPHPAAIVAWEATTVDGGSPARVDACPLFRLLTEKEIRQ